MNSTSDQYFDKAEVAFRKLFDKAKEANEVQFVLSLCPEFRGCQDPGWSTWQETSKSFDEIIDFIKREENTPFKTRTLIGFYCHLSEASGFYECPKNLLRLSEGSCYRMWPFLELNRKHGETGKRIAPNANRIFKDLIGHATELEFLDLAEVFKEAFDPRIRNAFFHSDYILWSDGFRIRNQACGHPETIPWNELEKKINRGLSFYDLLRELIQEYLGKYKDPVEYYGCIGDDGHKCGWRIEVNKDTGQLSISSTSP